VAVAVGAPRAALPAQSRSLHALRMHKGHRRRSLLHLMLPNCRSRGCCSHRAIKPAQRRERTASTHGLRAVQDARRAHAWGGVAGVDLELASADTLQPARYATCDRLLAQARAPAAQSSPTTRTPGLQGPPEPDACRTHGRQEARRGCAVPEQRA